MTERILSTPQALLVLVSIALVNFALRFLPSLIFNGKRKTPRVLSLLGRVLPHAIMGMLVVYCLRNITFTASPFGLPELIACMVTGALHAWKHNSLISIGAGVVTYMLLVQLVF